MITRSKAKILGLFFLIFAFPFVFPSKSYGYTGSCPDSMDPTERLECLNNEYSDLSDSASQLESAIDSEQSTQQTLEQQIIYATNKIKALIIEIGKLETDIERNNVEIIIIGNEIDEIQGNIDTLTQEINLLETSMIETTKAGYKMTFVSPIELLLGSGNFDSMLRKMKYIAQVKERDRDMLSNMSLSKGNLEAEEDLLIEKRAEVQELRNKTEEERSSLIAQNVALEEQKSYQQALIIESRNNQEEYTQSLDEKYAAINAITLEIAKTITATGGGAEYVGYVPSGALIGYMGNTGLSTGAHLHFCINDGNPHYLYGYFWGTVDPFDQLQIGPDYYKIIPWFNPSTWLWEDFYEYYIYSRNIQVPILTIGSNKPYLTQDWHQGLCIDMSSQAGYNAPIVSVMAGDLTRGVDGYGGQWAKIVHPNGWVTTYLHLQ